MSRFYIQTNTNLNQQQNPDDNENNYFTIYSLHVAIMFLQIILMPLFSLIGGWIDFIIKKKLEKFTKNDENLGKRLHKFIFYEFYSKTLVFFVLIFIFIAALMELTDYSKETFNSVTIAVMNIILSSLMTSITVIALILLSILRYRYYNDDGDENCSIKERLISIIKVLDFFITIMSFMFLGYFFPYMLIGFIQNPLQSSFIYISIFAAIILLSTFQIGWLLTVQSSSFLDNKIKKTAFVFTIFLAIVALPYLLIMVITLFSFGGFDDFSDLKNVILPLLTSGLVSLLGIGAYYAKTQQANN